MTIEPKWLHITCAAAMSMAGVLVTAEGAQADEATQHAMIVKWAGNYDTDAFLRLPAVQTELQKLLGPQLEHLMHNLNVRGAVDLSGQTLSVNGNAPHQGTEEEAIVCATVLPLKTIVEAAILSKGAVTVYTRDATYENASICIKDWITLVNSGHIDRVKQPANVRVVSPPPKNVGGFTLGVAGAAWSVATMNPVPAILAGLGAALRLLPDQASGSAYSYLFGASRKFPDR